METERLRVLSAETSQHRGETICGHPKTPPSPCAALFLVACIAGCAGDSLYCTDALDPRDLPAPDIPEETMKSIYEPADFGSMAETRQYYNPYQRVVVVPLEFPDSPRNPGLTKAEIRRVVFGQWQASARMYFAINSYFTYGLQEAAITDWAVMPKPKSYYASPVEALGDFTRSIELQRTACWYAGLLGVDWAGLDSNQDGLVTPDEVQVVFVTTAFPPADAGSGATRALGDIEVATASGRVTIQRQRFVYISCWPSAPPPPWTSSPNPYLGVGLGILCHELGHALFGLPDRYGDQDHVGPYDEMNATEPPRLLCMPDRVRIGWIRPPIVVLGRGPRACYRLRASEEASAAVIVYTDQAPRECWIIENRFKKSAHSDLDGGLPESGLAVWWLDLEPDSYGAKQVALIDAADPGRKPLSYGLGVGAPGRLFKFNGSVVDAMLFPQYGQGILHIRRVSPEGLEMTLEF